jgi:predicted nucleic acid-binding protein
MIALDSSILIAALVPTQAHSNASAAILRESGKIVSIHALTEIFSTLTGGKLSLRLLADDALRLIRYNVLSVVGTVELRKEDLLVAFSEAQARGVRGGAIYDYLHLFAARKAGAEELFTLNSSDFQAFWRSGDPRISYPS